MGKVDKMLKLIYEHVRIGWDEKQEKQKCLYC